MIHWQIKNSNNLLRTQKQKLILYAYNVMFEIFKIIFLEISGILLTELVGTKEKVKLA